MLPDPIPIQIPIKIPIGIPIPAPIPDPDPDLIPPPKPYTDDPEKEPINRYSYFKNRVLGKGS
jgi:hypothetical protein